MTPDRPDLSHIDPAVVAYIEALEAELAGLRAGGSGRAAAESTLEATEPPTSLNLVTVSRAGLAKRTPRHHYSRQRRGGMGIFDMETRDDDPPAALVIADEADDLLVVTSLARAFRLPLRKLPETPIRGRGGPLADHLPLDPGESVALVLPHRRAGYLNVLTDRAQVRRLRHHFFGDNMTPGNLIYDTRALGRPLAACWSDGSADLFVATRQGKAIRFAESLIPAKGCLTIRLSDDDAVVGLAGVSDDSGIFLLTADGKGTIRLMSGFSANKAPGAGGKVAIKADDVVGVMPVAATDDIFIISRLSKLIRFQAEEVPPKEGVVQGVNCMALRADETVALVAAQIVPA